MAFRHRRTAGLAPSVMKMCCSSKKSTHHEKHYFTAGISKKMRSSKLCSRAMLLECWLTVQHSRRQIGTRHRHHQTR
jgi:hypothetical protein